MKNANHCDLPSRRLGFELFLERCDKQFDEFVEKQTSTNNSKLNKVVRTINRAIMTMQSKNEMLALQISKLLTLKEISQVLATAGPEAIQVIESLKQTQPDDLDLGDLDDSESEAEDVGEKNGDNRKKSKLTRFLTAVDGQENEGTSDGDSGKGGAQSSKK